MSDFAEPINTVPTNNDVRDWLAAQMKDNKLSILLAFADDGVIWGRHDGTSLTIAHDIDSSCPDLRGQTLQTAHAFNDKVEVRLFRDEPVFPDKPGNWKAHKLQDKGDVITESQILWGDKSIKFQKGFLQVEDNTKGIPNQFIPAEKEAEKKITAGKCFRLEVHHSIAYNNDGEAHIAVSRLAGLKVGDRNTEVDSDT